MIVIGDKIVSDEIVEEQFLCDLDACKGVCCVEGDGGAPLEPEEVEKIKEVYPLIEDKLSERSRAEVSKMGYVLWNVKEGYNETPLINGAACVYLNYDEKGIAKCAFEQAYEEGKTDWKKPVSCHLYPVRITKHAHYDAVNYDRWDICSAACTNGKKHKLPIYKFVKEALIRKYGAEFYEELDRAAEYLQNEDEG